MSTGTEIAFLFVGLMAITIISKIVADKIKKHLSGKIATGTYLLLGILGVYYLVESFLYDRNAGQWRYCFFWFLVVIIQFFFFIQAVMKFKKLDSGNSPKKGVEKEL